MAKITKATYKKFLKENSGEIFLSRLSRFDGMYDSVMSSDDRSFYHIGGLFDDNDKHYYGIYDCYICAGSRNYFKEYVDSNGFVGIDVQNSCGHFIVAIHNPELATLKVLSK